MSRLVERLTRPRPVQKWRRWEGYWTIKHSRLFAAFGCCACIRCRFKLRQRSVDQ